jgi:hypothetical protein
MFPRILHLLHRKKEVKNDVSGVSVYAFVYAKKKGSHFFIS